MHQISHIYTGELQQSTVTNVQVIETETKLRNETNGDYESIDPHRYIQNISTKHKRIYLLQHLTDTLQQIKSY